MEQLEGGPHPDRARMDAELLLCHVLDRNRAWLIANRDAGLSEQEAQRFQGLLERRAAGEPIQYILGETEFYGLPFRVTREVLIPRPETELLVEKVVALTKHFASPRIVDIGTGSGAIAVALARHLPNASITAVDLSGPGLVIARDNAKRNGVSESIRFLEGDLLAPAAQESFDIVVSNPPYIPDSDRASLAVEVRDYEPGLALFAGDDGLALYRRLIPSAFFALVPGGFIALEIGFGQAMAVNDVLKAGGFEQVEFTPDLQGIPRVTSAQRR
jgi:release factor glutamine methyltransferase